MTQEFHISITPVRDNEYLVRTEQVAPGVPLAEEQLVWPVDEWLDTTRQLMNDPLIGLLQGQEEASPADVPSSVNGFMQLGQELYRHLFQGILRDSWMTAQGIAQHRGEILRLRLGLKGADLPKLPWEVMHGHTRDGLGLATHPLSTGVNLLFSRYQPDRHIARQGMAIAPLQPSVVRILMVVALPTDQDPLNLDQEARHLQQELRLQPTQLNEHVMGTLPDLQVTILNHPSRAQLAQTLEQSPFQVLHYSGHSDLGANGGKLYLVDQHGLTETLTGDDLAGLLANNGIQMAVFNSCRGGHTANSDAGDRASQRTLTDALVGRGIPAVLAMAERIPDDVALTLTRLFYRNLKQGYPVDLSLSRARQGLLAAYGSKQLYWALPTLYLHPDFDGYLTTGDRLFDNPADALARIPHLHTPSLMDLELTSTGGTDVLQPSAGRLADMGYAASQSANQEATQAYGFDETAIMDEMDEADDPAESITNATSDALSDDAHQPTPSADSPVPAPGSAANPGVEPGIVAAVDQTDTDFIDDPQDADDNFLLSPEEMAELVAEGQDTSTTLDPAPNQDDVAAHAITPAQVTPSTTPASSSAIMRRPSSTVSSTPSGQMVSMGSHQPQRRSVKVKQSWVPTWVYPLAGAAALAIAFVGYRAYMEVERLSPVAVVSTTELISDVEASIDARNLEEAQQLLDEVPKVDLDEPTVAFLQGRLIWERLRDEDPSASIEDATRYWQLALSTDEDPLYYNALGFAFYAEGRMNDAIKAWGNALTALEQDGVKIIPDLADDANATDANTGILIPAESTITNPDALTAYAGTALALAQMAAASDTMNQSVDLMSRVVKLLEVIRNSDSGQLDPEVLQQNWLWTDNAITEWEYLSQVQSQ